MINIKAAKLFDGLEDSLIWSCLQGHMGYMLVDKEENPTSALIDVGDFCFLAGTPTTILFDKIKGGKLLIPKESDWEPFIERFFGEQVNKILRYAIKKEPDIFDKAKLNSFVNTLDRCYELRLFDQHLYELAQKETWSADLCSLFNDYSDYQNRAIGVGVLYNGELVAGASSYAIYDGGIEIEIDTKPEYRRKGLATVCGARLILECLARNIYPSWDAHDLRSVALAEKLGYNLSHSYVTYEQIN